MDVQKYSGEFTGKAAGAALLTLAAALALWLFITAGLRRTATAEISRSLITINSYKAAQIKAWREDRGLEALRLSRHPILGGIVAEEELSKPGSKRAQLDAWIKEYASQEQSASMALLSPKGAVIAGTPGYRAGAEKHFTEAFAQASLQGKARLTDLYLAADGRPRMTMISPISSGGAPGGKTLCLLVTNIDPVTEFYPLVKAAPLLFATAETVLVRREGEKVLFLTDLDYSRDSALKLTRPLSDTRLPAAKALKEGYSGFYEGVDYRGRKVLGALNRIEGPDWVVITKVDREEILSPVRTRERLALALILLAAGLVYLAVYSLLRRGRAAAAAALEASRNLLAESEARYRALIDASGDGILTADLETLKLQFANRAICRMFGYTAEELTALSVTDIHPGEALPAVIAEFEAQARGEKILAAGLPCLRKDGSVFYADISTTPVTVDGRRCNLGIFRDVTGTKLAEEGMRRSERELKEAMKLARLGNWVLDLRSNELRWSDEVYSIFGIGKKEFRSSYEAFLEAIHPEDRELVDKAYTGSLKTKSPYNITHRLLMRDGAVKYVNEFCETFYDKEGRPLRSVGTVQDITERKLAELELEKLNRDLVAKRLEMENFLYITSHDLRTPLVNIQGFAQSLERCLRELKEELSPARLRQPVDEAVSRLTDKEIPEALKFVLESSRKMDALISSLLKVARLGRMEIKPRNLDMNDLLKKVVSTTFYQLEEVGAAAKVGVLPPCKADPAAVSQIFANLLENSIKYRAEGRALSVTITGEASGTSVLYKVADNGSGIAAKDLDRIWDIFYQGAGAGEGEGIGLTVVKYMTEKTGGSIKAESEEGRGTVFCLELPAAAGIK